MEDYNYYLELDTQIKIWGIQHKIYVAPISQFKVLGRYFQHQNIIEVDGYIFLKEPSMASVIFLHEVLHGVLKYVPNKYNEKAVVLLTSFLKLFGVHNKLYKKYLESAILTEVEFPERYVAEIQLEMVKKELKRRKNK